MSVYRRFDPTDVALPAPPSRARTPVILAVSALLHVAVLGASAWMQPKAPPPPREITVMQWEAVQLDDGQLAWRNEGLRKARVRGDVTP